MRAATQPTEGRTFRSGPYLRQLFSQAEQVDAKLQAAICGRIQLARKEAGYTQQEMADLLGMTLRGYQNYESKRVPFRWLDKIGELTGKSQEWLLRGDVTETQPDEDRLARLEGLTLRLLEEMESLRNEIREARPGRRAARTRSGS